MEITYKQFSATRQLDGHLLILVAKEVTVWLPDDPSEAAGDDTPAVWKGAVLVRTNVHNDALEAIDTVELGEEDTRSILQQVADLPDGEEFTFYEFEEEDFQNISFQLLIDRVVADGHMPILEESN